MHDAAGLPDRPRLYEPLGEGATLVATRVRAWMAIVAIATVVATTVADALRWGTRADAWRQAVEGTGTLDAALQAQHEVEKFPYVDWVCLAVSALALVYWSYGIIRNATARGVRGIHRAEAFYWFLPLLGIRLAIKPLQHSVRSVGYSEHRLTRWLWVAYITLFVVVWATMAAIKSDVDAQTVASKLDSFDTQAQILWVLAVWTAISATIAILAIRHTDKSVSKI